MTIREANKVTELLLMWEEKCSNPKVAETAGPGVSVYYVAKRRRELGIASYHGRGMEAQRATDWDAVDWSLGNGALAERFCVGRGTVSKRRRRHARETLRVRGLDWDAVDWSKSSVLIAAELGCHPVHVNRMRRVLAPHTMKKKGRPRADGATSSR